ncbi:MAG: S8 family serine peptidase, partial [Bacteroidota bacterium]
MRSSFKYQYLVCTVTALICYTAILGQNQANGPAEFIIQFAAPADPGQLRTALLPQFGDYTVHPIGQRLEKWQLAPGSGSLNEHPRIKAWKRSGLIERIEPNVPFQLQNIPNDPLYGQQWPLNNVGQQSGTPMADLRAEDAWSFVTEAEGVLGIIDTGIDYGHEDLGENIWQNLAEDADGDGHTIELTPNGWILDPGDLDNIDADGNGYTDDLVGWDFVNNDNDPFDDNGHGTHVAGIIGARGNNGIGLSGVAWQTKMMALKAFDANGSGSLASILPALAYARSMGVVLTNNSWGGVDDSQMLYDEIQAARDVDQLFITAAGNSGREDILSPTYPSSYDLSNIISVAASDNQGKLAAFSNFGNQNVDVAAPGRRILSTLPNHAYGLKTGTSMATAFVSGAMMLLKTYAPELGIAQLKSLLAAGVDSDPSFVGKVFTGGRLNLFKSLIRSTNLCEQWQSIAASATVTAFAEDGPSIWVGTLNDGLYRINRNNCSFEHFTAANSVLNSNEIRALQISNNGSMYAITPHGLFVNKNNNWSVYTSGNSSLPASELLSLTVKTGTNNVWIGTKGEGLTELKNNNWTLYHSGNSSLPNDTVYALAFAQNNALWIGTWDGVVKLKSNTWDVYPPSLWNANNPRIKDLVLEGNNKVWFATEKGVIRKDGSNWDSWDSDNSPLPSNWVRKIGIAPDDSRWLATTQGLISFTDTSWFQYTAADSKIASDDVYTVYYDRLGNAFVGTGAGFDLFSPSIQAKFEGDVTACINTTIQFENLSQFPYELPCAEIQSINCNDTLALWTFDGCNSSGPAGSEDCGSNAPIVYPSACLQLTATEPCNGLQDFYCEPAVNGSAQYVGFPADTLNVFKNNRDFGLSFSVTMTPDPGEKAQMSALEFSLNTGIQGLCDPVQNLGVRVTVNGEEIYRRTDLALTTTWQNYRLDFSDDPDFTVGNATTFEFELLGYNPVLGQNVSIDLEDMLVIGGCCPDPKPTCIEDEYDLAIWDFENCDSSGPGGSEDCSSSAPSIAGQWPGLRIEATELCNDLQDFSCKIGVNGKSMAFPTHTGFFFIPDHQNAARFSVSLQPEDGLPASLSRLGFYVQGGPEEWDRSLFMGVRVSVDEQEIFRQENIFLSEEWEWKSFDFTGMEGFSVNAPTTFEVEILPYGPEAGATGKIGLALDDMRVWGHINGNRSKENVYTWKINGETVSHQKNLGYTFAEAGEYLVSLIARNDDLVDSVSQVVQIDPIPVVDLGADTTLCADIRVLVAPNEKWDFLWTDGNGLPLSQERLLPVNQSGTYILTASNQCGNVARDTLNLVLNPGCIWPGDVNLDGIVSPMDFLVLGLANQQSGPSRSNAETDWAAQQGFDWSASFAPAHPLAAGVNFKHADCDGNGLVNLAVDGSVIRKNLGFITDPPASSSPNGAVLQISHLGTVFSAEDTAYIE